MMNRYIKKWTVALLLVVVAQVQAWAGDTLRVLFIGNSYTYVNDLPQLVKNMASSTGDYLITASNTIGGYTLQQHSTNATTLSLIAQGSWDFVVLQEQSQLPSFPDGQVASDVYPYARKLDSLVKLSNACAKTVFYMTWGRKNGDASNCASFPPVCSYEGMDSLLQLRYTIMADSNNAVISPVAKVWRRLRNLSSTIELYDTDESHPSLNGSYAAACSFYTIFFRKNPLSISYTGGVAAGDAGTIRMAAKTVVYDSLNKWYSYYPSVKAGFSYMINGGSVSFTNQSVNSNAYEWAFGNGNTSTTASPVYTYPSSGTYNVRLIAKKCKDRDTIQKTISVGVNGIREITEAGITIYPNPVTQLMKVEAPAVIRNVSVYDVTGKLLLMYNGSSRKSMECNMQSLSPGYYTLKIMTQEKVFQISFQKQ